MPSVLFWPCLMHVTTTTQKPTHRNTMRRREYVCGGDGRPAAEVHVPKQWSLEG